MGKEELPSTFLVPECPAGRGEEDPVLKHFQIPLSVEAGEPQPQRHSHAPTGPGAIRASLPTP